MTEAEWLASTNHLRLVDYLYQECSPNYRKGCLFAVASCHRIDHLIRDARSRDFLKLVEAYADGNVSEDTCEAAFDHAEYAADIAETELAQAAAEAAFTSYKVWNLSVSQMVVWVAARDQASGEFDHARHDGEQRQQAALLRDIFGNPFRPVSVDASWLTSTVVKLAEGMYESRDFVAMPILADALQDAGCDSADILDHCRSDAPHVRGCWVVDLVLGKS